MEWFKVDQNRSRNVREQSEYKYMFDYLIYAIDKPDWDQLLHISLVEIQNTIKNVEK